MREKRNKLIIFNKTNEIYVPDLVSFLQTKVSVIYLIGTNCTQNQTNTVCKR